MTMTADELRKIIEQDDGHLSRNPDADSLIEARVLAEYIRHTRRSLDAEAAPSQVEAALRATDGGVDVSRPGWRIKMIETALAAAGIKAAANAERRLKEVEAERDRYKAPGRRTEGEYERMGRPDDWTYLPAVRMWARLDQDHVDALVRAHSAERALAEAVAALERLGSSEAFHSARLMFGEELRQRMNYARAASIRARWSAPAAGDGWMPIASAPKDGTLVDLSLSYPLSGKWQRAAGALWEDGWRDDNGVLLEWGPDQYGQSCVATHYRLPPAPPVPPAQGGADG